MFEMPMRHLHREAEWEPGHTSLRVQMIRAGKRNVGIHKEFKALRRTEMI